MRPNMNRLLICILTFGNLLFALNGFSQEESKFVGGLEENEKEISESIVAVRNDVAQPSDPIVTKRLFKIKKGAFPEVLKISQEGIWPFIEKIGGRVIGMWLVVYPEEIENGNVRDYDEVILMTQYASYDHWKATRSPAEMGGNGPDWRKAIEAFTLRQSLTLETVTLQFLQGSTWHNPPYFMPGIKE